MSNTILLINKFTDLCGRIAAYLALLMMLITVAVVVSRRGFDTGSIAMQELIIYCHAGLIMLGIAYAQMRDKHVRVDVFYRYFNTRQQAWVNCLGILFLLLPFAVFLLVQGWDFFIASWQLKEASSEPGGLPTVYLLKSLVVVMPLLLIVQTLALFMRDAAVLIINQEAQH